MEIILHILIIINYRKLVTTKAPSPKATETDLKPHIFLVVHSLSTCYKSNLKLRTDHLHVQELHRTYPSRVVEIVSFICHSV